jgi:hypothetical protein
LQKIISLNFCSVLPVSTYKDRAGVSPGGGTAGVSRISVMIPSECPEVLIWE